MPVKLVKGLIKGIVDLKSVNCIIIGRTGSGQGIWPSVASFCLHSAKSAGP